MMVSPSATKAASTNDALARRSEARTAAALSGVFPRTTARRPSILMLAPMRTNSCACMKRFSKMFSVTLHKSMLRKHVADAADLGADGFQLFFDFFVTAVDVVDAVDDGFAIGDEGGEDQRCAGAQVTGQDGGGAERGFATDYGAAAFNLNVGAHANQFLRVH